MQNYQGIGQQNIAQQLKAQAYATQAQDANYNSAVTAPSLPGFLGVNETLMRLNEGTEKLYQRLACVTDQICGSYPEPAQSAGTGQIRGVPNGHIGQIGAHIEDLNQRLGRIDDLVQRLSSVA